MIAEDTLARKGFGWPDSTATRTCQNTFPRPDGSRRVPPSTACPS